MDQVDKCLIVEQLVEVSRISDAERMKNSSKQFKPPYSRQTKCIVLKFAFK